MKAISWLLLCILGSSARAATYRYYYDFSSFKDSAKEDWTGEWYLRGGYPKLPIVRVKLLLPPGEELKKISFEEEAPYDQKTRVSFLINPLAQPMCVLPENTILKTRAPFQPGDWFPRETVAHSRRVGKHGFELVEATLFPIQYRHGTHEARYIKSGHLIVDTTNRLSRTEIKQAGISQEDRLEVRSMVDNPELIDKYPAAQTVAPDRVDYLVVAPAALLSDDSVRMFLLEKALRGIQGGTLSLEAIDSTYKGTDQQERVRAAISDYYKNRQTRFALLVGDGFTTLPTRRVTVAGEEIRSDLYFGCLDGAGNTGASTDDLACEVAIGRAPVNTVAEFRTFAAKTLQMQMIDPADPKLKNVFNFGEKMDYFTLGSWSVDLLLTGAPYNNPPSKGYPSTSNPLRYYDSFYGSYTPEEVIEAINTKEFYTINHLGHAKEDKCMRLKNTQLALLKNPLPFFAITQGCHPGNLAGPNWATNLMNLPNAGAGAIIANSSYGWYSPGGNDGPSNLFHRAFYDVVFREGTTAVGKVSQRAKEILIPNAMDDSQVLKVLEETNLFGDPELNLLVPH